MEPGISMFLYDLPPSKKGTYGRITDMNPKMPFDFQLSDFSLLGAGLVTLADSKVIPHRTVLAGTASWLDVLVLAPGIHTQQQAPELSANERPPVAAMTTGYVFCIENSAMVRFLQDIGTTGCLTNVSVSELADSRGGMSAFARLRGQGVTSTGLYLSCCGLTLFVLLQLFLMCDIPGITVLSLFSLARFINVLIIKRRTIPGWKGAPEPGEVGDLLILVSEDRWIRLGGMVDDIKAVTSGEWFSKMTLQESFLSSCATFLVYTAAALVGSASPKGVILIVGLMIISAGLLGLCNVTTESLHLYGRHIKTVGTPKKFKRRLELADELIRETGRDDWAISLGMIKAPTPEQSKAVRL